MAQDHGFTFTSEEMAVNDNLGYPKAYAKLCRDRGFTPYSHGPPFTFLPYALHHDEVERSSFLDEMFPIIDPKAKPTTKPKIFVSILWNQLSHLGNAGFDPAVIRVDAYGNVLYYHADSASPLAWDFDHWFPCSRGGLTVLSNLRIVQRQVCRRKKNKLEFLVPWWDFQLGISVNQFLSIFASSKSDFRHRGFSFLFSEGENHELNDTQIVDSHSFPQHFIGFSEEVGLAPAAIVESRRDPYDVLALRQLDHNKKTRPMSSAIVAARKSKDNVPKENEDPNFVRNPYQAIVMARDSLKQKEEASKMQVEMQKLDNEVNEMKLKNEEEKLVIQDLELALIKQKRKAEKCRRLAEAQSSYRTMLEKMIRDTMHQSVIYKEQVRLNQAASNALTARLEAQRSICDNAEKEFYKKYKQKDDIEKQLRPEFEQGRKRFRMDDSSFEEERENNKTVFYLPGVRPRTPFHKELRVLLDEEQRASEAGLSANEEELKIEANNDESAQKLEEHTKSIVALDEDKLIEQRLQKLEISEGKRTAGVSFRGFHEKKVEEDDQTRNQRGKGNVEKWLQLLLENGQGEEMGAQVEETNESAFGKTEDIIQQLNQKFPQKELRTVKKELQVLQDKQKEGDEIENDDKTKIGKNWKEEQQKLEKKLVRSESAKVLRRIPSSPSLFQGMKSSIKSIKKAVKL